MSLNKVETTKIIFLSASMYLSCSDFGLDMVKTVFRMDSWKIVWMELDDSPTTRITCPQGSDSERPSKMNELGHYEQVL